MRETALYTGLTSFVLARLQAKNGITGRTSHEQFEQQLSAEDRCFAKLDILLGQFVQKLPDANLLESYSLKLDRDALAELDQASR